MKQQSLLDTIHILHDKFFEQEKKIANYVIQNHQNVINMTISELAKECGTSVATVTRFCRKCGVDGFHHLKIELAREIVEDVGQTPASSDISLSNIGQSLNNILANKVEELRQTVSLMDERELREILNAIRQAGMVQFAAVGNTIPVVLDGSYKFNKIGIRAMAGTIWETQLSFALSLRKGDVLIAVSNSGESRKVATIVERAKKNGAVTVGITNNPASTIGSMVDYHIQTATRERLFLNEFCFSRISAMTVIEILYLFLTVDQKDSYKRMSKLEHLMADEKF